MAIQNPPQGYHTVTPSLTVEGAVKAIEYYARAFGAEELMRMPGPDGRLMHAEIRIGDSIVMLSDAMPEMGNPASSSTLYVYTDDCDALYQRAVGAGARSTMEPADMFWGDRMAQVTDPFGIKWGISTKVKDLTEEEMRVAGEAFMKQMAEQQPKG
jgi:PhnB protein